MQGPGYYVGRVSLELEGPYTDEADAAAREAGIDRIVLNRSCGWDGDGEFLRNASWIREVSLSSSGRVEELSWLTCCTQLEHVELHIDAVEPDLDLSGMVRLRGLWAPWWRSCSVRTLPPSLKSLFIWNAEIGRLSEICGPNLETLNVLLGGTLGSIDPSRLRFLSLESVRVGECNQLEGHPELIMFDAEECSGIHDVSGLAASKKLMKFRLARSGRIKSARPLGALEDLRHVSLAGTVVEDGVTDFLHQLPRITRLHL